MIAKAAVRRVLLGVIGLVAACVVGVASAAAAVPLVSGGSLSPAFDSGVFDYTVRCDTPVVMHVDAPVGTDVSVDGKQFQSGVFDVPVRLGEDESFTWVVRSGGRSTGYHDTATAGLLPDGLGSGACTCAAGEGRAEQECGDKDRVTHRLASVPLHVPPPATHFYTRRDTRRVVRDTPRGSIGVYLGSSGNQRGAAHPERSSP